MIRREFLKAAAFVPAAMAARTTVNVLDHGATPDGKTLNTGSFSKAIQACAAAGGGTLYVPPGTYLSGPIRLASNLVLHLEAGAEIRAATRLADYAVEERSPRGESTLAGLITARDCENVAITGRGVIDGSGMAFVYPDKLHLGIDYDKKYTRQKQDYRNPKYGTQHGPLAHGERPGNLVRFFNCRNVLVSGVTIQNSPTWTVQVNRCSRVSVIGVNINSAASDWRIPNDDGIDLVESRYIHIADCDINVGDDCIASFGAQALTVTNCTLTSRSSGVRVGFTEGDTSDCTFSNLTIDSHRGLGVFVRGASSVENVLFSNITMRTRLYTGHWWGSGEPIHISALPWDENAPRLGRIRGLRFSNVVAESEAGIVVYGCPQSIIEDVAFEDLRVRVRNSALQRSYGGNFDLRSTRDLALGLFEHDIPGFYFRHVKGLRIDGLRLAWDDALPQFFTHGIRGEDFRDVEIRAFEGRQAHGPEHDAAIALARGRGLTVRDCRAAEGTGTFLRLEAVADQRLFVNNDLRDAREAFQPKGMAFTQAGNLMS
jgi:hypothetical protein